MGLLAFDCASWETAGEEGESGAAACGGGEGMCDVVLWKRRGAQGVEMHGARKSRTGPMRGKARGQTLIKDMLLSQCHRMNRGDDYLSVKVKVNYTIVHRSPFMMRS